MVNSNNDKFRRQVVPFDARRVDSILCKLPLWISDVDINAAITIVYAIKLIPSVISFDFAIIVLSQLNLQLFPLSLKPIVASKLSKKKHWKWMRTRGVCVRNKDVCLRPSTTSLFGYMEGKIVNSSSILLCHKGGTRKKKEPWMATCLSGSSIWKMPLFCKMEFSKTFLSVHAAKEITREVKKAQLNIASISLRYIDAENVQNLKYGMRMS